MSGYRSIKELVIQTCAAEGSYPTYEKLTSLVRQHFPDSRWQKTHWHWYKSQINTGRIMVPGVAIETNGPSNDDDIEADVEESLDASVSLERDLHSYLATRVRERLIPLSQLPPTHSSVAPAD
jgi:hypothetical protein